MKKEKTTKKATSKPRAKSKAVLSVSPSAWMVWEKCALSLQNVKAPFVLERDEYALEGTRLHNAISNVLKGAGVPEDRTDDAEIVRFAVDTVKLETVNAAREIDQKISSVIDGVDFTGYADVLAVRGDTVIVPDFKTGWREVEAEGNSQLKIYAHAYAAVHAHTARPGSVPLTRWKGIIINARFNSVSYAGGDIDPDYLSNLAADILARIAKKQFAVGNHCAYCQRLSTCAKVRAAIAAWIKPGAIDSITREPERLAEALRLAKPAEKLFETIKKEAQLFIDLGGVIPGTVIEYTAGTRTWPRDMTVGDIAERIGLTWKDMTSESTISPAEATRRGADKDAINAIALRPPRKGFKFI